jgi:hypothetical protein
MPIQTFSAKVAEFKVPTFYKLMYELSKGNDELTFVVCNDRIVVKTKSTSTLNIMVTIYRNLFTSFQTESPRMYTVFSRSIRDVFSKAVKDLSSLQIIIEESDSFGGEYLMIFEICRKMRSIRSRYNILCNKISNRTSEIEGELEPFITDPSSEENHLSIDSVEFKTNYWPQTCKNETVRFLFGMDSLRVINITSTDVFESESRYSIPDRLFNNYDISNPVDIKINRKSFERVMLLVHSLKCNLNAHFSDKDSVDPYQPQPFYLCGEIKRYIKIEGKIFGAHIKYGNEPERPFEIESSSNASNQISNDNDRKEYQVASIFRQTKNTGLSNPFPCADENYMPVACSSVTTLVNDNVNTMNCTYGNNNLNRFNTNRINTNDTGNRGIHSVSNYNIRINNTEDYEPPSSDFYGATSDSSFGDEISRRLETVKFSDSRVKGIKRSFSEADLSDDSKYDDIPRTIRSNMRFLSQDQ